MANGVWLANNLKVNPAFSGRVTGQLLSTFQSTNFADPNTAADINGVVKDATHGKFTEIVKADEIKNWVFALLNAVYFKANWRNRFDRPLQTAPFYIDIKTKRDVAYMSKVDILQVVNRDDGSTVVAIPYGKSDDLRLILILPSASDTMPLAIPLTLRDLANGHYSQITAQLNPARISPEKVELFIPPFEFQNSHDLIRALKSMGMLSAFTPEADFQGMTPEGVFVTAARQLAMGRVDQNGSEFSAATIVGGTRSMSVPRPPRVLRFDRPFIFSLDYKGTPLFAGVLSNPLEAANRETAEAGKDAKPAAVAAQPAPSSTDLIDSEIYDLEALKTATLEERASYAASAKLLKSMRDFLKKHNLHKSVKLTIEHPERAARPGFLKLEFKFLVPLTPQQSDELNLISELHRGTIKVSNLKVR
jgi:serpin B